MVGSSRFSLSSRTCGNPPGLFARNTSSTPWTISAPPSSVNCSSCTVTRSISFPTLHAPRSGHRPHRRGLRPYGSARDTAVQNALEAIGVRLVRTGSPYAIAPGRVTKQDGTAYRVFTPFYRAWLPRLAGTSSRTTGDIDWWMPLECQGHPTVASTGIDLPEAGEEAAWKRWAHFHASHLSTYDEAATDPISTAPAP